MTLETISYERGAVRLLDQTRLPATERILDCRSIDELIDAIRRLVVRGAPAIGVAAAYGCVLAADLRIEAGDEQAKDAVLREMERLAEARPTAINLRWALQRMRDRIVSFDGDAEALREVLLHEARAIHDEDRELCKAMGRHGAKLLPQEATVITHCNTGALATGGIGTALGVVFAAVEAGKKVRVFADESRPLLQGARLTAYELTRAGIEVHVLADGAAAWLMRNEKIDAVLIGSDRIAANGDVANKIGSYGLAVNAQRHDVPFYVVAPYSTLDFAVATGADIPIEMRDPLEVHQLGRSRLTPKGAGAYNPAFDVTPAELVSAIVTERGIFQAPYETSLRAGYAEQTE